MTKKQYAEFHKLLAMLIYEYNKRFYTNDISEETRSEIGEMLLALEKIQKICIIDMENK